MNFNFVFEPILDENRRKAEQPVIDELSDPERFIERSRLWFQDYYGFRDLLITLKTQIDYSVFGVSDRLYIGKDGWLFYHSVIDHEKIANAALTDDDLDRAMDSFMQLRDILAARKIHLIIITNQLKDKFYPEFLPDVLRSHPARDRFDDFRDRLHALSGITYIDPTQSLMKLKDQQPIFHKTDFHWNDPAAAEIAHLVVDSIAAREHKPQAFWRYPKTYIEHEFSGGQARELPLFVHPSEIGLFADQSLAPSPGRLMPTSPPFAYAAHGLGDAKNLLPAVVWYGDSFSNSFERVGLIDYFNTYYRVNVTNDTRLRDVLESMPSDTHYFVFQSIEVKLPYFKDLFR
jgi:hypothetical protein